MPARRISFAWRNCGIAGRIASDENHAGKSYLCVVPHGSQGLSIRPLLPCEPVSALQRGIYAKSETYFYFAAMPHFLSFEAGARGIRVLMGRGYVMDNENKDCSPALPSSCKSLFLDEREWCFFINALRLSPREADISSLTPRRKIGT